MTQEQIDNYNRAAMLLSHDPVWGWTKDRAMFADGTGLRWEINGVDDESFMTIYLAVNGKDLLGIAVRMDESLDKRQVMQDLGVANHKLYHAFIGAAVEALLKKSDSILTP